MRELYFIGLRGEDKTVCGILGWMITEKSAVSVENYIEGIRVLFSFSETRGKDAAGVCSVTDEDIYIVKTACRARELILSGHYKKCLDNASRYAKRLVMGHARMVTNGNAMDSRNNQPVAYKDLVCIHNGIIVNSEELWGKHKNLKRKAEIDTEIFLALMEQHHYKDDVFQAFQCTMREIEGSLSIAMIDRKSNWLFLYTNVGSLYVAFAKDKSDLIFASEQYILEKMLRKYRCSKSLVPHRVSKLKPNTGMIVDLSNGEACIFNGKECGKQFRQGNYDRKIWESHIKTDVAKKLMRVCGWDNERKEVEKLLRVDIDRIHALRRCKKCLLPETFPGIEFDDEGVCDICNSYKKVKLKGKLAFERAIKVNHREGSRYDCIAPISGGRDSCYILHYLVKELRLKPVAYTYDWGLVTDLARRNIQRMCSELQVEHILISADIKRKRENVRKNVEAWLKRPALGTIPLFMAGDKQFFYFAQLLKRQMHVDNVIFGMNALEETRFKARFTGLGRDVHRDISSDFSNRHKLELFVGYAKEFLKNPAYINMSLWDSFMGFLSYYALPQRYLKFFDYISWDQKRIEDLLINEYHWETSKDTGETWRIGDGTAPFYNYIYYRMAGFTEFDTFKSNQIREGTISREDALASIDDANRTPVDGFLWYCKTIGIDPVRTLKIINSQRTLY